MTCLETTRFFIGRSAVVEVSFKQERIIRHYPSRHLTMETPQKWVKSVQS